MSSIESLGREQKQLAQIYGALNHRSLDKTLTSLRDLWTQITITDTTPDKEFSKTCQLLIKNELSARTEGLWYKCFTPQKTKNELAVTQGLLKPTGIKSTEKAAMIRFLSDMRKEKGATAPLSDAEYQALRLISHAVASKNKTYEKYKAVMTSIYEGEHVLIEGFDLYEKLKAIPGAELRWSSHYDKGDVNGKAPSSPDQVENPQYHISGDHLVEMPFSRVTLATDVNGKPIFSKTAKQTQEAWNNREKNPRNAPKMEPKGTKNFTWLQLEGSKDNDSIFTKDWWNHRVRDFCRYAFFKLLGFEKPNIGPHGRGHGDNNPTVL